MKAHVLRVNEASTGESPTADLGFDSTLPRMQTIEVLDGLKVGDKVILSDMSDWEKYDRIQIK